MAENKGVLHLDLSFNSLQEEDIRIIGEELKHNQTLLGIHLMGNEAKIDEQGFVIPEKNIDMASTHVYSRLPCKPTKH